MTYVSRGSDTERWSQIRKRLVGFVVVGSVLLVSCGEDDPPPPDLSITVTNNTQDTIWAVRAALGPAGPATLEATLAGGLARPRLEPGTGRALRVVEAFQNPDQDGGCVQSLWWFVRSISGTTYWLDGRGPSEEQVANDLEVIDMWDQNTCFETDRAEYQISGQ